MKQSYLENIGSVPWSRADLISAIDEFRPIYEERPMDRNDGGMRASHLFLSWFLLTRLSPEVIIESGVFKGQGTWLFERACPNAKLHCIDPRLHQIEYESKNATYYERDFDVIDFSWADPERTVCFFDDHQNALSRVMSMKWKGLKHVIFEDNYPPGHGDCYSLKTAFMEAGHEFRPIDLKGKLKKALLGRLNMDKKVPGCADPAVELRNNLESYWEGPPLFKLPATRWGQPWTDDAYPTPEPLLAEDRNDPLYTDPTDYTWMCYARLK